MRSLFIALSHLTRYPVPRVKSDGRPLGRSAMFFPLAGAAVGVPLTGAANFSSDLVSPVVAALVLVTAWTWLTRGVHLAELTSVVDALATTRHEHERARGATTYGRDSSYGTIAVILVLLAKLVIVSELLAKDASATLWLIPTAARGAIVPVMAMFGTTRGEGFGRDVARHLRPGGVVVALLFLAGAVAAAGFHEWPTVAATFAATLLFALWLWRTWGGLSGDAYGACIEMAEVAGLMCLLQVAQPAL